MNTKITRKTLENLLTEIATKTGKAISRENAEELGLDRYLWLEYASVYGGWRVVNVVVKNGAHAGAFGGNGCEARVSASKMYDKLSGILAGLEMAEAK